MATYKTTSGDYTISLGPYDSGSGEWSGVLTVNGNLNVVGNITSVSDIKVNDAFIVVAGNNTGTVTSMGLVAQKTFSAFAGLRFNTTSNTWQISSSTDINGVGTYSNIAVSGANTTVAGSDTQVQFNQGGAFGASGNLTFDYANNRLTLSGAQYLGYSSAPPNVANTVAIYSNVVGSGGTGLYFTSNSATDELVSKSKAIVYGIIF